MNLYSLLKEYAGLDETEVGEWFIITETETETVLKPIRHLDGPTFNAVYKMAVEHGGTYDNTAGARCFLIPKVGGSNPSHEKLETALAHAPIGPIGPTETAEEYALSRSLKGKLGQLVPCLEDANGIMFDGFHRKKEDPKAWTVKRENVKTPVDRALARMTVNFCRRHYTSEEMRDDIGLLIGSGLSVEQIIEVTGISESTVRKYKPEELKDQQKVEAGKQAYSKSYDSAVTSQQTVKTQDTPVFQRIEKETLNEIVECASCHMGFHISRATLIDGKNVCPRCAERVKPQPKPKIEPIQFKPKETGDFRVATMHPQKSKFELAVIQELQAEGLPLETDQDICVVKTRPDAILRLQKSNIAIYIDNEATHPEGNGRDEFLRSKIEAQGWKVLPLRWKNDTEKERQQAKEQVKEFLKW
jgi:hypothetical protein